MTVLDIVRNQIERNKERLILRITRNSERQPALVGQEVGCLLWIASKNNDSYPRMNFWHEGKHVQTFVHHVTWALFSGEDVPEGHERDHTCNARHCIEPRHIEIVTHAVNMTRIKLRRMQRWAYADAVAQMVAQNE